MITLCSCHIGEFATYGDEQLWQEELWIALLKGTKIALFCTLSKFLSCACVLHIDDQIRRLYVAVNEWKEEGKFKSGRVFSELNDIGIDWKSKLHLRYNINFRFQWQPVAVMAVVLLSNIITFFEDESELIGRGKKCVSIRPSGRIQVWRHSGDTSRQSAIKLERRRVHRRGMYGYRTACVCVVCF